MSGIERRPARKAGRTDRRGGFAGVSSVNHAIAALKAIPTSGAATGVSELARRIGLHKSTVSRLLTTLERHDFVRRDPDNGGVSLGLGLVALVSPLLANLDIIKAAKPLLAAAAEETGETTHLAVWNGRQAVMVEQVLGTRAVVHQSWPGKAVSAHATAAGKVFLAFLPGRDVEPILCAPLERYTEFTITGRRALEREIALTRRRGYGMNDQEFENESCGVAVPIRNSKGEILATFVFAVPKHRFTPDRQRILAEVALQSGNQVSRQLGWA